MLEYGWGYYSCTRNRLGMPTVHLDISGMTCRDCAQHVREAIERIDGVASAAVDYRSGRASVELEERAAMGAVIAAVAQSGYGAELARDGGQHGPTDFDVVVIGTGGAGVAAAIQASEMGGRVGIAEGGTLGGTCVNVGCIPSKTLVEAAAHYHAARRGFPGIAPCEPAVSWRELLRQKDALVGDLRQSKYADVLASYSGITLLDGRATISGMTAESGAAVLFRVQVGDVEHRARKLIVATGSAPAMPLIPGLDQVDALTSTTAMTLEQRPASLIVLGGGPVGVELGQIFARFGTKVTILQRGAQLLTAEDEAISAALRTHLEAEGLEIHTSTAVTRVERAADDGVVVHVMQGSLTGELRAERILVAAGRRPNTHELGLHFVGVAVTQDGFVQVDATMRTSHPDIYAAGDVTGGPGYVYVAASGGRVAAENAMKSLAHTDIRSDAPRELDLSVVPRVTFTAPQVASVGLTEAQATAQGYHVKVSQLDLAQVPRALVSYDTRGLVKIVADAGSEKLLGVHAVTPFAGEIMGEAALAIRFGLTARDLSGTLHPYLTWGESLKLAAQGFSMDVAKLSCCA